MLYEQNKGESNLMMLRLLWGNVRSGECVKEFLCIVLLVSFSGLLLRHVQARNLVNDEFPGTLIFHNGKLTAQLDAAPLQEVMEAIGELSGAEIVWLQDCGTETVSADFSKAPLARALRLILGKNNFLLFYSSDNDEAPPSQIWISGQGRGRPRLPAAARVNFVLLRRLQNTALRNTNLSARLRAVEQLKRYAHINVQARSILAHLARWANHLQVRSAASEAVTTMQARR